MWSFLNHFGGWSDFRDRETIVRQELSRKRRIERFEKLGPDLVRADLAQGGHRLVGGSPKVRELALEWLAEKEGPTAKATEAPSESPWMLRPNIHGVGVDLPKLWQKIKKWWRRG